MARKETSNIPFFPVNDDNRNNGKFEIAIAANQLWQLLAQIADIYWQEDEHARCTHIQLCTEYPELSAVADMSGQTPWQFGIEPLGENKPLETHLALRKTRQPFTNLLCQFIVDEDKHYLLVSGQPRFDDKDHFLGYHCLARDVSAQQMNENRLKRFRAAMDMSGDMIHLVDRETMRFIDVNETACKYSGYTREELLTMGPADTLTETAEEISQRYDQIISSGQSSRIENIISGKSGKNRVIEVYSRALLIDQRWIIIGMTRDVTAHKRAEEEAHRLQQMFSALSASNEAILRATTVEELYENVCKSVVKGGKFCLASIRQPDQQGWLRPIAYAGNASIQPDAIKISIKAELPEGQGIAGTAFREEKPCISNDFRHDKRTRPWRTVAVKQQFFSGGAFPLFQRKKCVAVLLFYSTEYNTFDQEIVKLLEGMAENISYALDSLANEQERNRAERQIRESEERFRSLTQLSSDFYWEMDVDFRITQYSGKVIGENNQRALNALLNKHLWEFANIVPDSYSWEQFKHHLHKQERFKDFEFSFKNDLDHQYHFALAGEPIFDEDERFLGYRGISKDITARKRASEHIKFLATHDNLTGLPNRVMFAELLEKAVQLAKRYPKESFAVLFIDLDRFKTINDTFGHHIGDTLLMEVAGRLKQPLRESDVVARLGGDEFVILLQHTSTKAQIEAVAGKILASLSSGMTIQGRHCQVSCSIGVSLYGQDAFDQSELMQHADAAMYIAKQEGKNNFQFYSEAIHLLTQERNALEINLQNALARDEFSLHYQAKLDLQTGRICGVEALLRWQSAVLGSVGPDRFIPVAEDTGQIVEIGEWVLCTACQQLMQWHENGIELMGLAVNISARQFNDPDLVNKIKKALDTSKLPAKYLELEITEGVLIHNSERVFVQMKKINKLGVTLALDDFGTGYSSFAQLKNYPIHTLKIDRSFIEDIPRSKEEMAIVKAIISMSETLGLTVVAEGVEKAEQLQFLQDYHCNQIQGFFFHRPVDSDTFQQWYRDHEPDNFSSN
ncbi:MAG: EAL domain-containing protein [Pseudomonadales bacterium]|nr:EAL domain-containing protein [Pseudomonadales bacterium]